MNYVGTELELFAHARNWKTWFASRMAPYVRGRVLDVGSGMGVNAPFVINDAVASYTFLEPDSALLAQTPTRTGNSVLDAARRIAGTTSNLAGERFDTLLYVDVIEHIEDSKGEVQRAFDLLEPGGHLVILVPAFQFLFSPFDKEVGHYRRYTKSLLRSELPVGARIKRMHYFDSVGMLLSLANRLLLKQGRPTLEQVRFWDSKVVPVSRLVDPLVLRSFGRSMLAVAQKPG